MKITKIVFDSGLEVSNLTQDTSDRIGLLLFAKKTVETSEAPKFRKRKGWTSRRWTESEDSVVRQHYSNGWSLNNAAAQLKRTPKAVEQRVYTLRLKNREPEVTD